MIMALTRPYVEGQLLLVTHKGVNSWLSYDGVAVTKRAERFYIGEVILLVSPARTNSVHPDYVDIWLAVTSHGLRYFLFTSLKSSTTPQ